MLFITLGLLFVIFYAVVRFYSRKNEVPHYMQADSSSEMDALVRRWWLFSLIN